MFPNVRLMTAATLASVVALICGFGLFAAFRVSHDPLVRLPPAVTAMQPIADNAARVSTTVAPGEPFDRRFHISAAPNIKENVSLPARGLNLHDDVEFTPSVAPEATTPAAPDDTTASAEPKDAAALPALQPAETPAAAAADSATSPAPTSDPPAMVPRPESSSAAASTDADRAPPAPAAAPAEAEQETKVPVGPGPGTEPAAVPGVAAIEPGRDWRGFSTDPPAALPNADGGPLSTENPPANAASERRDKKTKHTRTVARPRRVRVIARADALPSADRNVAFAQPNPDTAPRAQTQFIAGAAVRIRPAKIASGRSKEPNSAIGGPFVSAPSR